MKIKTLRISTNIIGLALNRLHHIGAFSEYSYGQCDVLSLNSKLFGFDYEIKINKYDLLNEIHAIQTALLNKPDTKTTYSKYNKHQKYLHFNTYSLYGWRPNYFYFAVPKELIEIAKDGVKGTPYGVLQVDEHSHHHPIYILKAKPIHKLSMPMEEAIKLLRKASFETYNARRRLYLE